MSEDPRAGAAAPEPGPGWALVGLGRHAERYVGPAFASARSGRLVATCSRDLGRAREFADEHGAAGARGYDSLEALLDDGGVDCVFVCSENALHEAHVLACATAGRDVLVEKPLSTSVGSARAIVDACERAGVTLAVGFHLRHNPAHVEARRLVRDGLLGTVLLAHVEYMHLFDPAEPPVPRRAWRGDRARGGGEFIGTGVHGIDLARFLLGDDVERVYAARRPALPGGHRAMMLTLGMDSGAAVAFTFGHSRFAANGVSVIGSNGAMHLSGSVGKWGGGTVEVQRGDSTASTRWLACDPYAAELDDFAGLRAGQDVPSASGWDGLRAAQVVDALEESLAAGREVKL